MRDLTSNAAKELSSKGASKGGHARANTMSPERRREIAQKAIAARWEKAGKIMPNPVGRDGVSDVLDDEVPYSMFQGKLKIGDIELECHVLNDHRRVFTQREIVRVISGGRESGNLRGYLDGNPLIEKDFYAGGNIPFRIAGQPTTAIGWEATGLVEICEKYLKAKEQGLLKKNQFHLATQAGIVVRSSAKVGIIALVDEATGYDKFKQKQEYQLKLQAFIADEIQEWARMFPDEFWFELARLEKIRYSPRSRPLRWGKYVMMFVYDAVDGDIGKELRKKNPDPHFLQNHHQWLKKFGREKVHDQITKVVTIMQLCENMEDFRKKFDKVFKKTAISNQLTFGWEFTLVQDSIFQK